MGIQKVGLRVAIVGTGTMGKGIVQILAQSDAVSTIIWKGSSIGRVSDCLRELELQFARMVGKKRISEETAKVFIEKILITQDYIDLTGSDCMIEAVSENISEKKKVFSEFSKISNAQTILASNTSSLSITELGALTLFPSNVVGIHFFNPAPIMKLAEIIAGLATSSGTVKWALDFTRLLGKEPVLVNEAPGFIVNRMLIPMINEAIGILAESVASAEEIDKAMRLGANHPIGPLALADLIGNDVCLSIMETLHDETGDPKYRAHPLLRKMVRGNHLGRKSGDGFFKY